MKKFKAELECFLKNINKTNPKTWFFIFMIIIHMETSDGNLKNAGVDKTLFILLCLYYTMK